MDRGFFSCFKCRSQSPKAVQHCDSCTSPQNPCVPWLCSQVDGKNQPVTYVWAVGGRWVQSLHWCHWGHVRTSLLLNLLQKDWLACQRNNLNDSIWTELQGCCPMSSVERVRQKDRGTGNCIKFRIKFKYFLISSLSTSACINVPGVCLKNPLFRLLWETSLIIFILNSRFGQWGDVTIQNWREKIFSKMAQIWEWFCFILHTGWEDIPHLRAKLNILPTPLIYHWNCN